MTNKTVIENGAHDHEEDEPSDGGTSTVIRERTEIREPKLFKVFLLNDDYTTMDFVVSVLESIFMKSPSEATRIMLEVHHKGSGLCGVYPKEIAEVKVVSVENRAQEAGYPLRCSLEEA